MKRRGSLIFEKKSLFYLSAFALSVSLVACQDAEEETSNTNTSDQTAADEETTNEDEDSPDLPTLQLRD